MRYRDSCLHKYRVDSRGFPTAIRCNQDAVNFTNNSAADVSDQRLGAFRLVDFYNDHLLAPLLKFFRSPFKLQLAFRDNRQVRCNLLNFGKQMTGEEYCHAATLG